MKRPAQIVTIGYEGASLEDFVATLRRGRVSHLLDIRELPISRRRGFSKTALADTLAAAGITYTHERALGSPRELRHQLRNDGNLERFFVDFREYLATRQALVKALADTLTGTVALLCYERNPAQCHRSVVAAALARRTRTTPVHLTVPHAEQASTTTSSHPRQSVPAT